MVRMLQFYRYAAHNLTAWLPHNPPADPHRNKKPALGGLLCAVGEI